MSEGTAPRDEAAPSGRERLVDEARRILGDLGSEESTGLAGGARIVGIGWATVELDRASTELASAIGLPGPGVFGPAEGDAFLGAASRVATGPDGPSIVLLEPVTEGRLAGFLARHGEAVATVYVTAPDRSGSSQDEIVLLGRRPMGSGPLGPQRPLAGDRHGPWVLAVGEEPSAARPAAAGRDRSQ